MKHRYLFGLLLGLVCSCLYLFHLIYSDVKEKTIADFNSRQLIHARQAGRGIEEYLGDLISFLTKAAEDKHIIDLNDQGKEDMAFALKTVRQDIKAISRVDETGRIIYTLPYDATAIGRDISYQKHIREIMNTRKPVVSDVFTSVQGYNAVALHVPVFKGKEFRGTLAYLIDFQSISKRFLEEIKIGETGYAWMISRDGIELYCPVPGHTGKSVFENCKDFPTIISMAKEMVKGHQGVTTYTYNHIRNRKTETIRKNAVYLPVEIGNTFWTIVVASSEDEVLASLKSFRNKLIFLMGLLLLIGAVFSFYGMRARGIMLEEEKRQKVEKELRDSEERYREIVETATDLICTHDLKGTLLSVNAAAVRAMGLAADEVVGLSIPDMVPPERRHEFDDYIRAVQSNGTAAGTVRIVTRDGDARFWEYRNTLRTKNVSEPVVQCVARNVTGEIIAKRALRKSEKGYRLLFERNLAGVYRTTLDGRLLDCNYAFNKIYGYDSSDEAMQHAVEDFHAGPEARLEFIEALRKKGMLIDFESRGRRKDGNLIWLLENAALVSDEEGELTEIEGTLIDITERKRTEKALQESEEKYRLTFSTTPDAVSITRLEDGLYVDINNSFSQLTGFTREEVIGKTSFEIDIWKDNADRQKLIRGLRGKGFYENLEACFRRKNGSIGTGLMSAGVISLNGIPHIISITRDISERKRMEEELLKADKLESVGILAGGIAHDFNNILTSIIGNISLAKIYVKSEHKIFDLLNAAETASMRARGLTAQLLTFAKGGVPAKETASISNLIKESSLFMLRGSRSRCEFFITEDLLPVDVDMGQISQVISNIVINANQSMPEGGILRVAAGNLVLEENNRMLLEPGRYVHISVKDQGIGIEEKHLKKIFDPYFSTKKEGSGLGLAIAYSIIKKHNGHISVDSCLGSGTTFNIYLPASDKDIPVSIKTDIITGKGKILLMDDDRMLMEMAGDMLKVLGYEPEFSKNGIESIEMYRKAMESEKPYDAVILDLTIPGGMGGKEVIKKLLELDHKLKAIVCSGYSDDPVMSNYREYGFKGMMPKPFDLHALGRVLNDVLKGAGVRSQ